MQVYNYANYASIHSKICSDKKGELECDPAQLNLFE